MGHAEMLEKVENGEIYRRTRCMFWNGKMYEPVRQVRYLRYNTGEWTQIGPCGDTFNYIEDKRMIRALENRRHELCQIPKGTSQLYQK